MRKVWLVYRLRDDGSKGPALLFRWRWMRDAALRAFGQRGFSVVCEEFELA